MYLLHENIPNFFFYESKRLAALSRLRDPLEELHKHIDFNILRSILTDALRKAERKSPAGRKPLWSDFDVQSLGHSATFQAG